jgi:hypothetical protein
LYNPSEDGGKLSGDPSTRKESSTNHFVSSFCGGSFATAAGSIAPSPIANAKIKGKSRFGKTELRH